MNLPLCKHYNKEVETEDCERCVRAKEDVCSSEYLKGIINTRVANNIKDIDFRGRKRFFGLLTKYPAIGNGELVWKSKRSLLK